MDLRIGRFNMPAAADIPVTPPPDVLREVEAAGRRAEELWNARRELHFDVDEESGRLVIHVRDLEGGVVRTIPPSEALDIMSGRGI
jgi:hypothetical protein